MFHNPGHMNVPIDDVSFYELDDSTGDVRSQSGPPPEAYDFGDDDDSGYTADDGAEVDVHFESVVTDIDRQCTEPFEDE